MDNDQPIGVIGLGLLGTAIAERLLASGFHVIGYDIDVNRSRHLESLGGEAVESAAALAHSSERIILSLPTSQIAEVVVSEMLGNLRQGAIVIDTTTGDPDQMESLGKTLVGRDVSYLDATVGGSSQQLRERDVIVMVGGSQKTFDACRDLFDTFADRAFYIGPSGHGARMKLAVNLVLGLNRAVLAEGLAFAQATGLDAAEALEVFKAGPAYSRAMDVKGQKMLDGDFEPQARLSQHLKDVRLILDRAERTGTELPLSKTHRTMLEDLEASGYGDKDNSAVIKAYE